MGTLRPFMHGIGAAWPRVDGFLVYCLEGAEFRRRYLEYAMLNLNNSIALRPYAFLLLFALAPFTVSAQNYTQRQVLQASAGQRICRRAVRWSGRDRG
jgi:hypothetical protein